MIDEEPKPDHETREDQEYREKLEKIKWTADEKKHCLRNPWISSREQSI